MDYLEDMIVRGTGEDDYDDEDDDMFGNGVLMGGARKKKRASSYNSFVKKYAKKKGLSIPEAAHEIKRRGLWKGTAKKKRKAGSKTAKRRYKSKVSKRKAPKRKVSKKKAVGRRRKVGRPRGSGEYGGANIDDLEAYVDMVDARRKQSIEDRKKNIEAMNLYCKTRKNTGFKDPKEALAFLNECKRKKDKPIKLTQKMKNILLEHYLDSLESDFSGLKKKRLIEMGEL